MKGGIALVRMCVCGSDAWNAAEFTMRKGGGEAGGLAAAAVPLHLVCDVRSQMHGADVG